MVCRVHDQSVLGGSWPLHPDPAVARRNVATSLQGEGAPLVLGEEMEQFEELLSFFVGKK